MRKIAGRTKAQARTRRVRSRISGSSMRPRLTVFVSNQHIFAQIIDDTVGQTLVAESDVKLKTGTKSEKARAVGLKVAAGAKEKNILQAVFDRGAKKYHGRIKALADGAREGGLEF